MTERQQENGGIHWGEYKMLLGYIVGFIGTPAWMLGWMAYQRPLTENLGSGDPANKVLIWLAIWVVGFGFMILTGSNLIRSGRRQMNRRIRNNAG